MGIPSNSYDCRQNGGFRASFHQFMDPHNLRDSTTIKG